MPWSDLEHRKCTALVEKTVEAARVMHRDEEATATSPDEQRALADVCKTEMSELALLTEAVRGRDAIGICAVATAMWRNKAALQRRCAILEQKLPGSRKCEAWAKQLQGLKEGTAADGGHYTSPPRAGATAAERKAHHEIMPVVAKPSAETQMGLDIHMSLIRSAQFEQLAELSIQLQRRLAELETRDADRIRHARALMSEAGEEENEDDRVARIMDFALDSVNEVEEAADLVSDFSAHERGNAAAAAPAGDSLPSGVRLPDNHRWAILRRVEMSVAEELEAAKDDDGELPELPTAQELAAKHGVGDAHLEVRSDSWVRQQRQAAHRNLRESRMQQTTTSTPGRQPQQQQPAPSRTLQPYPLTVALPEDAVVTALQILPVSGVDECMGAVEHRIDRIENVAIPQFDERIVETKDRIWQAEIDFMTERNVDPERARQHHEGCIAEYRSHLETVEAERARLMAALQQCRDHRDALSSGDVRQLSLMLDTHHAEALSAVASRDKTEYTTRELEGDEANEVFLERLGLDPQAVFFFTGADGRRMAYVPTAVPRVSLTQLDSRLQDELTDLKRKHQEAVEQGERVDDVALAEALEQLAALRKSDAATLCELLTSRRRASDPALLRELEDHIQLAEAQAAAEKRNAASLKASLETVQAVLGAKDDAISQRDDVIEQLERHLDAQRDQVDALTSAARERERGEREKTRAASHPRGSTDDGRVVVYRAVELARGEDPQSKVAAELAGMPCFEFRDPQRPSRRMAYIPEFAERANVADTDRKLREALARGDTASAEPLALAAGALRSGDTAALTQVVHASVEAAAKAAAEAKAAAGTDVAAADEAVRQAQQRIADLESELERNATTAAYDGHEVSAAAVGTSAPGSPTGADTPTLEASISGADDARSNRGVLLMKLAMLREALKRYKAREQEMTELLEEYERRARVEVDDSMKDTIADLHKRLEAKTLLLESQAGEIDDLRTAVDAAERRREAEVACMLETRQRMLVERDSSIDELKRDLDKERRAHKNTLSLLESEDA